MEPPVFNTKYACIVNWEQSELVAIVSSYLQGEKGFLSVFDFPSSTIKKPLVFTEVIDEHSPTRANSEEQSIKIHNSLQRIGGLDCLIIVGLDEKQKSYLDFLDQYNFLEVDNVEEVESMLGGIAYHKNGYLSARPNEILLGLFLASKRSLKLRIDINAPALEHEDNGYHGVVVIENNYKSSTISAVNYALSINAEIKIVNPVHEDEIQNIEYLIKDWQDGNNQSHHNLNAILFNQLDGIDFSKYAFATFFTLGVPYSLLLQNIIPITYVHLNRYPSQFIVDNIYFETRSPLGSSVVFSPLEFGIDEETNFVINILQSQNYYVKQLIGDKASAYNIDMHVKEYPYDILHICSHGGEVNGYKILKKFTDRNNVAHTIEYDEVLGFYPAIGQELMQVESKYIFRKFDGLAWKSDELKNKKYPHYVFDDMQKAIMYKTSEEKYSGEPIAIVSGSCAIKCSDFIYQAMFNMLAGFHASPIIFNNTCWSWSGISDSFLYSGARGYIGTLWDIDNNVAKLAAETFYQYLFQNKISESLHKAIQKTKGTQSEDIYIYWGLHFASLKHVDSVDVSRVNIAKGLFKSFSRWRRHALKLPSGQTRENSKRLSEWNKSEIFKSFLKESYKIFKGIV